MKKMTLLSTIVVFIIAGMLMVLPVNAEPKYQTISGLECVYVHTPGQIVPGDNKLHIIGQVNQNYFYSDNPGVMPNSVHIVVLDAEVNLRTGKISWKANGTFITEGKGTWMSKGLGFIDMVSGSSRGRGIFHGTDEYKGMTIWSDLFQGDITHCPGTPFDATYWTGFIVPPGE